MKNATLSKRAKNKLAARQCRERKRKYMKSLERMDAALTVANEKKRKELAVTRRAIKLLVEQYRTDGNNVSAVFVAHQSGDAEVADLLVRSGSDNYSSRIEESYGHPLAR